MWKKIVFSFRCVQPHMRAGGRGHGRRWAWSRRAAVVGTCSQVELVALVMEHQQAVEVLAHF